MDDLDLFLNSETNFMNRQMDFLTWRYVLPKRKLTIPHGTEPWGSLGFDQRASSRPCISVWSDGWEDAESGSKLESRSRNFREVWVPLLAADLEIISSRWPIVMFVGCGTFADVYWVPPFLKKKKRRPTFSPGQILQRS